MGDRVEFVIVAAGAGDGHAEECAGGAADDFIESILAGEPFGFLVSSDLTWKQHGGGDKEAGGCVFGEDITGELLKDEAVPRSVFIEGADDIIAVGPGIFAGGIHFEAMRIGIANDVQPVLSPAFAVVGTGEQFIDQPGPCVRGGICDEAFDAFGGGQQTGENQRGAADECATIGRGILRQISVSERLRDVLVDGVGGGGEAKVGWWSLLAERLEGPVFKARVVGGGTVVSGLRPVCAVGDPAFKELDFFAGQPWAFRGHLLVGVGGSQASQKFAGVRITGHDDRAAVAPLEKRGPGIQSESPLADVGAVTAAAALLQKRPNLALEIRFIGRSRRAEGGERGGQQQAGEKQWVGANAAQHRYGLHSGDGGNSGKRLKRHLGGEGFRISVHRGVL